MSLQQAEKKQVIKLSFLQKDKKPSVATLQLSFHQTVCESGPDANPEKLPLLQGFGCHSCWQLITQPNSAYSQCCASTHVDSAPSASNCTCTHIDHSCRGGPMLRYQAGLLCERLYQQGEPYFNPHFRQRRLVGAWPSLVQGTALQDFRITQHYFSQLILHEYEYFSQLYMY